MAAFAAAMARGLAIECDVQLTADDAAVVFHDFSLERLTAARGAVIDHTAAELAAVPLTGGDDGIPSLTAMLERVAGRVPLLIEVKSRRHWPVARLCAAVARDLAGYRGLHAVMSFDPRVAAWFRAHAPGHATGLIYSEFEQRGWLAALRRHWALSLARPDFVACDVRGLPGRFTAARRRRGLPVATWTVRTPALRQTARAHADALIAEGEGVA